ncbi:DUF3068 domain-containing protein [Actinomadura sp. WMMB 499]|uniref:DUF3068 domain-containing protein n=1 Tax=Actinomadura sp. WMMB 499 TaxID=1219491 RepID=UPI0012453CDE|nr:DUF3068 domain-containing protein [Actinomadura sp. WMMB 499]QFG24070.1 DUF3068 domain-containing protein [Actinomadura sp. WMMB 499]
MRRRVGLLLICLGAFFLTLAPLVRFYVAEQVVRAPLNRYQVTHLESPNSTYFDQAALKTRENVTLLATNTVRGDVRANNGNDDIAVWDSTTNIYDKANPDNPVQIQGFRIAFDRRTAELVNCCGVHADGDGSVQMAGSYGLLFPIANVQKRDYPFYDPTTKQSAPMKFGAVEQVHGISAYRFTQHIPLTKTGAVDAELPGTMLGLEDDEPQRVDRYSEAYNTVWVDPRTGVPIKHRKNIRSTVRTPDGRGEMIVAQADLVTTEADQKKAVDLSDGTALQIDMVRIFIPGAAVLLGLLGLLIGGLMGLGRDESAAPPPPQAPRRSDGKFGDLSPPRPAKKPDGKADGKPGGKPDGKPDGEPAKRTAKKKAPPRPGGRPAAGRKPVRRT